MIHQSTSTITREMYEKMENADEIIYRDHMRRIISELPLEELKKVFKCSKINPLSKESEKQLLSRDTSRNRELILKLRQQSLIHYKVTLTVPNVMTNENSTIEDKKTGRICASIRNYS